MGNTPLTPEMRKLQVVGGSTFSVSVPRAWAEKAGLKAGDRVLLEPLVCGALRLAAAGEGAARPLRRFALDATHLAPRQVERRVIALYLSGKDFIDVTGKPAIPLPTLTLLETLPRRINGLEIVEQRADRVVLQDMVDPREYKAEQAFDRLYGLASRMHREILNAIAERDAAQCDAALLRKQDIDRLAWTSAKQHRLLLGCPRDGLPRTIPPSQVLLFSSATNLVQRLGRQGAQLGVAARELLTAELDDELRSGIIEVGTRMLQVCDEAARALHHASVDPADSATAKIEPLETRLRELQARAADAAATRRACGPSITANRALEWIHASALVGGQLADLAVQRACDAA